MKLARCLALMALLTVIVVTSINCVQNSTPVATPTTEPAPGGTLTWDQQLSVYDTAIQDPYVQERIIRTAWRDTQQIGDKLVTNASYTMGEIGYMRFTAHGPDGERTLVLPAAEIVPGNISQAGVNVIAFVDPGRKRVAYIGFVPRPGVPPAEGITFSSVDTGVEERDAAWGSCRSYINVTIVDTGFTKGMSLSEEQKDRAAALAMMNGTVIGYIGNHGATMRNLSVHAFETGYPHRYILAYPMVTIDVMDGTGTYDTVYALVDLINDRVIRVTREEVPII